MSNAKQIPSFRSEQEERAFWEQNDSSEYVDWGKAKLANMPSLKPSTNSRLYMLRSTVK